MKIIWAITGGGHNLSKSVSFMDKLSKSHDIKVIFSNAGVEVAKMYGLFERIKKIAKEDDGNNIIFEKKQGSSFPFVCKLSNKIYSYILVSPCSANTVAKIVSGISDSFVTNLVSQAVKNKIPVIIFPTDLKTGKIKTKTPKGKEIRIYLRDIDIENTKKLNQMQGINVIKAIKELEKIFFC